MNLIINNSSQTPIYEQIVDQVKEQIIRGNLKEGNALPSGKGNWRKNLEFSALTVKKAYDALEQEGYVVTVHGKGSYISNIGSNIKLEELRREVEKDFETAIRKGKRSGMTDDEIKELLELILEDM